jgi:hypothetical protein
VALLTLAELYKCDEMPEGDECLELFVLLTPLAAAPATALTPLVDRMLVGGDACLGCGPTEAVASLVGTCFTTNGL